MNDEEKTLEEALQETPWSAILIPLALSILVVLTFLVIVITDVKH
jgi:hypothetical protein